MNKIVSLVVLLMTGLASHAMNGAELLADIDANVITRLGDPILVSSKGLVKTYDVPVLVTTDQVDFARTATNSYYTVDVFNDTVAYYRSKQHNYTPPATKLTVSQQIFTYLETKVATNAIQSYQIGKLPVGKEFSYARVKYIHNDGSEEIVAIAVINGTVVEGKSFE